MAIVIITGSQANGAGGGDISLSAIDWANIAQTNNSGVEVSQTKTLAGISSPVTLRAEWTSTSSVPTYAYWRKNGAVVQTPQATPVEVTGSVNDQIAWETYAANSHPAGNYDTGTVTVTNRTQSGTCTMTIASPAVVTKVGHQFATSQKVRFSTTGALPTGVTAGTVYYVIAAGLTADAFQFSATDGGAAVNTSGSQSGTHTVESVVDTFTYACQYVRTGSGGGGEGGSGGYPEPPELPSG